MNDVKFSLSLSQHNLLQDGQDLQDDGSGRVRAFLTTTDGLVQEAVDQLLGALDGQAEQILLVKSGLRRFFRLGGVGFLVDLIQKYFEIAFEPAKVGERKKHN